ncbi:Ada metal-binding domain-containing protein [Xinfangfangia sp. CPCC 101601]|uniref:Ada metal-binding domain-containing protein n=1 Tax=Pseudogemmobacter lacusdianii TaxID=3069608 RepID=A0ABU0VUR2_9RHOB|nr:Ada metal-binding domain-containing protein [Xinfangfangia sp. CPCC 101601]MDQ2065005.1 Ada metal-binding domain-containing protein [Xinfangfangia sp. CPCC 101601]
MVKPKLNRDLGRAPDDAEWALHEARSLTGLTWAVLTTGIHCRDGCPAKPLQRNVRIFPSPAEAQATGYRPCKRCGG